MNKAQRLLTAAVFVCIAVAAYARAADSASTGEANIRITSGA